MNKDFWSSQSVANPLLSDDMVSIAENALGVKLPLLLIDLLKIQNGGYTRGFAFPMTKPTSWAEDHIPFPELYGIVINPTRKSIHNLLMTSFLCKEWGLPKKQVLLSGEGHYWITLDYRKSKIPSVRWIDLEVKQDIHVADTIDIFINGLVSENLFTG